LPTGGELPAPPVGGASPPLTDAPSAGERVLPAADDAHVPGEALLSGATPYWANDAATQPMSCAVSPGGISDDDHLPEDPPQLVGSQQPALDRGASDPGAAALTRPGSLESNPRPANESDSVAALGDDAHSGQDPLQPASSQSPAAGGSQRRASTSAGSGSTVSIGDGSDHSASSPGSVASPVGPRRRLSLLSLDRLSEPAVSPSASLSSGSTGSPLSPNATRERENWARAYASSEAEYRGFAKHSPGAARLEREHLSHARQMAQRGKNPTILHGSSKWDEPNQKFVERWDPDPLPTSAAPRGSAVSISSGSVPEVGSSSEDEAAIVDTARGLLAASPACASSPRTLESSPSVSSGSGSVVEICSSSEDEVAIVGITRGPRVAPPAGASPSAAGLGSVSDGEPVIVSTKVGPRAAPPAGVPTSAASPAAPRTAAVVDVKTMIRPPVPRAPDAAERLFPNGLYCGSHKTTEMQPDACKAVQLQLARDLFPATAGGTVIDVSTSMNRCWAHALSVATIGDPTSADDIRYGVASVLKAFEVLYSEPCSSADFHSGSSDVTNSQLKPFLTSLVFGETTLDEVQRERRNIESNGGGSVLALSIWSHLVAAVRTRVLLYGRAKGNNLDESAVYTILDTVPGPHDGPTIRLFTTSISDEDTMGGRGGQMPISHYMVMAEATHDVPPGDVLSSPAIVFHDFPLRTPVFKSDKATQATLRSLLRYYAEAIDETMERTKRSWLNDAVSHVMSYANRDYIRQNGFEATRALETALDCARKDFMGSYGPYNASARRAAQVARVAAVVARVTLDKQNKATVAAMYAKHLAEQAAAGTTGTPAKTAVALQPSPSGTAPPAASPAAAAASTVSAAAPSVAPPPAPSSALRQQLLVSTASRQLALGSAPAAPAPPAASRAKSQTGKSLQQRVGTGKQQASPAKQQPGKAKQTSVAAPTGSTSIRPSHAASSAQSAALAQPTRSASGSGAQPGRRTTGNSTGQRGAPSGAPAPSTGGGAKPRGGSVPSPSPTTAASAAAMGGGGKSA